MKKALLYLCQYIYRGVAYPLQLNAQDSNDGYALAKEQTVNKPPYLTFWNMKLIHINARLYTLCQLNFAQLLDLDIPTR